MGGAEASRNAIAGLLHAREPDLHDHAIDVGRMAAGVAERLDCSAQVVADTTHAAVLHDIGKLTICETILNKEGPLDDSEWEVMHRHTILGERLLAGIVALEPAARLVRSSHERWDGGGYPDGLAGTEIPVGARIIAACDAYDAMVTDRPYRRALGHKAAVAELRRCAGSQFDPAVVDALLAELGEPPAVRHLALVKS